MMVLEFTLQRHGSHEILHQRYFSHWSGFSELAAAARHTHVLANVLNLKLRSRAFPSEDSVHRPPDEARRGASADAVEVSSVPGENLGCIVEYLAEGWVRERTVRMSVVPRSRRDIISMVWDVGVDVVWFKFESWDGWWRERVAIMGAQGSRTCRSSHLLLLELMHDI